MGFSVFFLALWAGKYYLKTHTSDNPDIDFAEYAHYLSHLLIFLIGDFVIAVSVLGLTLKFSDESEKYVIYKDERSGQFYKLALVRV